MVDKSRIKYIFNSKVIFFDSSSKDSSARTTLDKIIKKIEQRGFQIESGVDIDLSLDKSNTPDIAQIAAIILNSQNAHDIARMKTMLKKYSHAHIFCIHDEKEIPEKAGFDGNLSIYNIQALTPKEIFTDISRKLTSLTTLKQGYILFFDSKEIFSSDRDKLSRKGICVDSATSHEELETKIRFNQSKINAVVIDEDSRAINLLHAAKEASAKTIIVVSGDKLARKEYQETDYIVLKDEKNKFNSDQLQIFIDKCVVPRIQATETEVEVAPLKRKSAFGMLVYIMGSSFSGKSTLSKNSLYLGGEDIQFIPKHSTRPLRVNEIQGADIISVSIKEFNELLKQKEFFHTFVYRMHDYGVCKSVIDYLRTGKNVIQINPDFKQLDSFGEKIAKEFNQNMIMPSLIFADKKTLEERAENLNAPEDEIELRKSMLDSELELFESNYSLFKYRFFTHNIQDPVELTKRLMSAIKWEEANPGLSYEQTHENYVNRVLKILTDRELSELAKNNLSIHITGKEIKEFCANYLQEEISKDIFSRTFPLEVKYAKEPNYGRIGLYILDKKRLDPMKRRLILNLLNYRLNKNGVRPKEISAWGGYHNDSIFGLAKAINGELCDGACYSLTDEYCLHPENHSPFMISVGFAKECTGKMEIIGMKKDEIFNLTNEIKPAVISDYEFIRAVRKYKERC
ncbi:hypothetical protein JW851_01240 [Candidatus Woesearchaeota archaeon]|nr:hypothetical protein [Candidatus Woesearchaeota archaeon]